MTPVVEMSTRHVTLKSPLLLQFLNCELCENDNKQSNDRLIDVLYRTNAIFADFSKSPKDKRQRKETKLSNIWMNRKVNKKKTVMYLP